MANNIRTTTHRASPSYDTGAIDRIQSADGTRWAYSRNRKRSIGNKRYELVKSWVIKARVDGKTVTVATDAYEEAAKQFVGA